MSHIQWGVPVTLRKALAGAYCCGVCRLNQVTSRRTGRWGEDIDLSVLKSHFARACIGLYRQLYPLWERRFVRTFGLQKGFSLLEAVDDGSGKGMVWVPKI